jgi:hypothetical protein
MARAEFLEGRHQDAAFHVGLMSHYALDNLVPHSTGARDHTYCESRFAETDREMQYPRHIETSVADGRLAERSVRQLVRLAATRPLNFEGRLEGAYVSLVRLARAVAEESEPLGIITQLAETFVEFANGLEAELKDYRRRVRTAFAQALDHFWDWEPQSSAGGGPAQVARRAVGVCELLRARGVAPAPHTGLLGRFALWGFRGRLLGGLEKQLGAQGTRHLRRKCKALARAYRQGVSAVGQRRRHWDWFQIDWGFWDEKGKRALVWVLTNARRTRERAVGGQETQFRKRCAAEAVRWWPGTRRDRLARRCASDLRPAASLYAGGMLAAPIAACALWAAGALPLVAAVPVAAAGALAGVLYARRVLRAMIALSACARAADEGDEEAGPYDEQD